MEFNSTEHPVTWFRDRVKDNQLIIKPPYQRNPIWGIKEKSTLIETILLDMPVPEVFVQTDVDEDGNTLYAVVDGQQRTRSILQFMSYDPTPSEEAYNGFALDGLETLSELNGLRLADLSSDLKVKFYKYKFSARIINTGSDEEIRSMFRRLNEHQAPIKAQELRNARYNGAFSALCTKLANNTFWSANKILTPDFIRRMGDVEYVSELLVGVMNGPQPGSSATIDGFYRTFDAYPDEFPDQVIAEETFNLTLSYIEILFPKISETRWRNKTDFYSLFLAIGGFVRNGYRPIEPFANIRNTLDNLSDRIDRVREVINNEPEAEIADTDALRYIRAIERGANDKSRRQERNIVLSNLLHQHFYQPN
ncbi:DUF262 domain-containing protein [Deinococcus kurensis]|uniref:DUF262 domain-containing protein n=1 Tax=Deinococcus kurensis TaxID=2662757 RepID=UPI0012D362D4|nr:DUF262 domain-containing protein [Deinococcus kurensis]